MEFQHLMGEMGSFPSKPIITALTMAAKDLAADHTRAPMLVQVIADHIRAATGDKCLPVLYLTDSILKNIGSPFVSLFAPLVVPMVVDAFGKVCVSACVSVSVPVPAPAPVQVWAFFFACVSVHVRVLDCACACLSNCLTTCPRACVNPTTNQYYPYVHSKTHTPVSRCAPLSMARWTPPAKVKCGICWKHGGARGCFSGSCLS